jgi:hypothetical protein
MNDDEIKNYVKKVRSQLSVTKVIATRSVKTNKGDFFVGFSAAWNTVQDDGMNGLETLATSEGEALSGMTTKEAKVAHYLVAMQADIAAHEAALANGALSAASVQDAVTSIRANYNKLIRLALGDQALEESSR